MKRILIVEDEPDIALGLERDLAAHGYEVLVARDGESAIQHGLSSRWDLILLDVMLPGRDGFEVCRQLRGRKVKTPVILLTARTHEADKVLGLELGADDYVTKPFSPRELRARIKAVLRRVEDGEADLYSFGDCVVDLPRAMLSRAGRVVEISALEFRILAAFLKSGGRVLSRDQLIDMAWGSRTFVTPRVVDTHIVNLRKLIEPDASKPRHLISLRGLGYRFESEGLTNTEHLPGNGSTHGS
jgi:DNA-binding response OmpR family regulator